LVSAPTIQSGTSPVWRYALKMEKKENEETNRQKQIQNTTTKASEN